MSEIATDVLLPVQRAVLHKDRVTRMTGQKITLHGVFIEVMQLGVLLSGASGAGKSELALELLNRGHRLIADDAPEFCSQPSGGVRGKCPELLCDFLEVRGLGVINIRAMFGDGAIVPDSELSLILHLKAMSEKQLAAVDRLRPSRDTVIVLEKEVPRITIPVAPGRNLAILAETAVRGHLLGLGGYDAAAEFGRRQQLSLMRSDA
jgi:HPr kinase/phosphorylase